MGAVFLGHEPHGEQRDQQNQDEADVLEQGAEDDPRRVEIRRRRPLQLQDLRRVQVDEGKEQEPRDEKEHRERDVRDRRREELPDLLAGDDERAVHARAPFGPPASGPSGDEAPSSCVTSFRKTSSRLIDRGRSSSSPAPASTTARATCSRTSVPSSDSTSSSPAADPGVTCRTPPMAASRRARSEAGRAARTSVLSELRRRAANCSYVSTATTAPWLMMMTRSQTAVASGRI